MFRLAESPVHPRIFRGCMSDPSWQSNVVDLVRRCFADIEHPLDTAAVQRCAAEARRAGARSEQMVVALRDAWRQELTARRHHIPDYTARLTQMIDVALEAYYGAGPA